jgi:acylphosphatase
LICYYLQVTGEAQGEQSALSQFVQHLNKGPPAARVSTVDHSDIATKEGEKGFNE